VVRRLGEHLAAVLGVGEVSLLDHAWIERKNLGLAGRGLTLALRALGRLGPGQALLAHVVTTSRGGCRIHRSVGFEDRPVDALGVVGREATCRHVLRHLRRVAIERVAEATAGRQPHLERVSGEQRRAGAVGIELIDGAVAAVHQELVACAR
jgi:hypothetical protein